MAFKFQYRSNSNTQAYYAKALRNMTIVQGTVASRPLTNGPSGTFGGTYLDMTVANAIPQWVGLDNTPIGTTAISILIRLIPVASGNPVAAKGILALDMSKSINTGQFEGYSFTITTTGKFQVTGGKTSTGTEYFNDLQFATALTLVANQPTDIWFVWDGTTTAGHVELWQAQNGNSPTKISTATASAAMIAPVLGEVTSIVGWSPSDNAINTNGFHINEIVIFDTQETPSSYGARTDFLTTTASAFEGYSQSNPGIANVRSGTTYVSAGITLTGTAVIPTAADVRSGTAVDAGTGTLVVPARGDVRLATAVDASTGLLDLPSASNVKTGVTFDQASKTGTYDGSDRWSDPGIANVRSLTAYKANSASNNRTGTAVIPAVADVRLGTSVDAATGTLDLPATSNVKSGVTYDGASKTGTLVVPSTADVRSGTSVGSSVGSLSVPTPAQVLFGFATDNTTGTYVAPSTGNVKIGVTYGAGSVLVGTYDGHERYTDFGNSNIVSGVSGSYNSLTNNRTGSAIAALAVTTQHGVTASDGPGTYRGADLWSDPGAASVLAPGSGGPASYLANGVTIIGTFAPNSTNPLIGNVKKGVAYTINGTNFVGIYDIFSTGGTPGEDVVTASCEGLATYLRQIAGLTVLTEFPYPNQKLAYPSVTITAGEPKLTPQMTYDIRQTTPDINGKIVVDMCVGEYEVNMQLDLWCRNKLERTQLLDQVLAAFDGQAVDASTLDNPTGLSLRLSSYFNEYIHFDIDSHMHMDDGAAAERQERREKIGVSLICRAIRQRTYYAMATIQTESQVVGDSEIDFTDDASNTESNTLP